MRAAHPSHSRPSMNYQARIRKLRATMAKEKIAALLVTHLPEVRYLCGFTGSNAAFAITAEAALLVTDGRYTAQASVEVKGAEVRIAKGPAVPEACRWLAAARVKHAYYDGEQTTVAALAVMQKAIKGGKGFFVPLPSPFIAEQRMVKDTVEIERMAEAAALGVRLFEHILGFMQPGLKENAV